MVWKFLRFSPFSQKHRLMHTSSLAQTVIEAAIAESGSSSTCFSGHLHCVNHLLACDSDRRVEEYENLIHAINLIDKLMFK